MIMQSMSGLLLDQSATSSAAYAPPIQHTPAVLTLKDTTATTPLAAQHRPEVIVMLKFVQFCHIFVQDSCYTTVESVVECKPDGIHQSTT